MVSKMFKLIFGLIFQNMIWVPTSGLGVTIVIK